MAYPVGLLNLEVHTGRDGDAGGHVLSWPEEGGIQATIHWQCPWSQVYAALRYLRGGVYGLTTILPHQHPDLPELVCTSIGEVKGIQAKRRSDGFIEYAEAVIPATYTLPRFDPTGGNPGAEQADPSGKPLTRTRIRVSTEVFSPPKGAFYWESGPNANQAVPESAMGVFRPRMEFTLTRYWLTRVPVSFCMTYGGTVNSVAVQIGDYHFPRGTLLFVEPEVNEGLDSAEGYTYDATWNFVGNGPVSDGAGGVIVPEWNQFMDADGKWYYIDNNPSGAGSRPYRYADAWNNLP
jgi:hypothetical protein